MMMVMIFTQWYTQFVYVAEKKKPEYMMIMINVSNYGKWQTKSFDLHKSFSWSDI